MERICKGTDLVETATGLLLESLPAPLKKTIDFCLSRGMTKADIIGRVAQQSGSKTSLITLAIQEYLRGK